MGCASSSPIVEGGKNLVEGAKETMSETINKGEKALQDIPAIQINHVGETAKGGFQSGIDSMKETMQSVANNAEQGVETVMGKIGDTFSFHNSNAKDTSEHLEEKKDEFLVNASDAAAEVVSEAETVLASEAESAKEAFMSKSSAAFETVHSMEEDLEHVADEVKGEAMDVLQDLEGEADQTVEFMGDSVERIQGKVEELNERQPKESPAKEIKKEE